MNSDGPQIISDFYLTVLLDSIKQNGYTIFVVKGELPYYDPNMFRESLKQTQFYFTVDQISKNNDKRNKEKNNEINLSGYDKRDMNKMLDKARREEAGQFGYHDKYKGEDEESSGPTGDIKPPEKKYFEGKGTNLGGGSSPNGKWYDGDTDNDTLSCIKMSLQDVILA
jgi:hypothetical protein